METLKFRIIPTERVFWEDGEIKKVHLEPSQRQPGNGKNLKSFRVESEKRQELDAPTIIAGPRDDSEMRESVSNPIWPREDRGSKGKPRKDLLRKN